MKALIREREKQSMLELVSSELDALGVEQPLLFGGVDESKIFSTVALVNAGNVMNVDCGEAGVLSVTVPPGTRMGESFHFTLPDAVQPSRELASVSAQVGEAEAESQGETATYDLQPSTEAAGMARPLPGGGSSSGDGNRLDTASTPGTPGTPGTPPPSGAEEAAVSAESAGRAQGRFQRCRCFCVCVCVAAVAIRFCNTVLVVSGVVLAFWQLKGWPSCGGRLERSESLE